MAEIGTGAGKGFSVNAPFPPYTNDETYLWAFDQVVPPLLDRFRADVVVTQLGVDTHYRDPLAQMVLTTNGQLTLFEVLSDLAPRWLAFGGGGYDISVVPRAWALAFGVMSGQGFPDELPEGYRTKYGEEWLHDREIPDVGATNQGRVRERVKSVVEEVKRSHHL